MKKIYLLYIVLISLATTSLIGCNDWTESEAKTFPESIVSDEYYAALRAYKQTDHQVAFGCIFICVLRVLFYFKTWLCHARGISE